ncbi:MAG: hypothetical protein H0W82_02700 [Actinobacteria bacterium]|nr:hypothetical protein [Actinomycetota bacterium]
MDDLELLKALPGRIEPADVETKARMRADMEALIGSSGRRGRRARKVGMLGIAAALAVAGLAAGFAIHPWTADDPVALQGISDPTGEISTPAELESVIAEFGPAIRLPDGGSYDVWIRRHEAPAFSDIGQGLRRVNVVHSMVFVAQCQWGQQWLDASAHGDQARAAQALRVLGGIDDWFRSNAPDDDYGTSGLFEHMKRDDRVGVRSYENGCGYTGSWGKTPAEQDTSATERLLPAVQVAQRYLRDGGDPSAFDPTTAGNLAPAFSWTSSHMQPAPASPGSVFIGPPARSSVILVSVSESGTQFCAVVTDTEVEHGTTTKDLSTVETPDGTAVNARYPGPITCTPGGW